MVAHLGRVRTMAAAWRGASNATGALLSETKLALDVWLRHDWQNPNWYDNEIGVPRAMGDIGLLLQPALSSAEATKIVEIMARADWKGSGTVAKPHWTGANLLDMLRIQIHRGAFVNRTSVVAEAFARSFAAVVPHHQNEESIMVDNSFHQHGPQLLAGAYGSVFTSDILDLAAISASTQFQMPVAAVTVFEGLVLDGQARMTRANAASVVTSKRPERMVCLRRRLMWKPAGSRRMTPRGSVWYQQGGGVCRPRPGVWAAMRKAPSR